MRASPEPDAPARAGPRPRVWFAHAIRGPACLLVVFAHLVDVFVNSQPIAASIAHVNPLPGLPRPPGDGVLRFLAAHSISPGTTGVMLFFLVSGFVVPFSLERRRARGFVVRRFFRLYPTLWVCLSVTVAALAVQAHFQGTATPYGPRALGTSALLIGPYARQPWVEPVLWSLAVEELFYAVAATVAFGGLLASRAAVLLAAGGLTVVCVATRGAPVAGPLFWLGFHMTYVCFILLGVVVHWFYRRRWGGPESLAIGAAIIALHVVASFNGPANGVAGIYIRSAVIAVMVFGGLYLARDRLPYSVWVDRLSNISYPLYLLHAVNGYVLIRALFLLTGNYYVAVVGSVAVIVAAATAVHRWVEAPTNEFGRRVARRLRPVRRPASAELAPEPVA